MDNKCKCFENKLGLLCMFLDCNFKFIANTKII